MHTGVMVTGYNQGDWERLLKGDYDRPPAISDAANMDETLAMGELVEPLGFDSIWATEHYGSAYSMQPNPLQYLAYWAGHDGMVRHAKSDFRSPAFEGDVTFIEGEVVDKIENSQWGFPVVQVKVRMTNQAGATVVSSLNEVELPY